MDSNPGRWRRGKGRGTGGGSQAQTNRITSSYYNCLNIPAGLMPLRMTSSFIHNPTYTTPFYNQQSEPSSTLPKYQSRKRKLRQRQESRTPAYERECICRQNPNVMFNSMYDFRNLGIRPDPEGCANVPTFHEEIIPRTRRSYVPYQADEPLFSDYGDLSDAEDDYVKSRKKQPIRDRKAAFAEAYSASKLNSGTLVQLAIVEAEMKNLVCSSLVKVNFISIPRKYPKIH